MLMLEMCLIRTHKQSKAQPRPAKQAPPKRVVDRIIYIVAFVEPLFSVPQAYEIYSARSAVNVSVLSWLGFEAMTVIWLWYAAVHRDKLLLLYQGLFFIIDGSVVVGALLYGGSF